MSSLVGKRQYQHMAPGKPSSINDDRTRTWTVSTSQASVGNRSFSLTMREKPGGGVTAPLFAIARKVQEVKPDILADSRPLELTVGVVGVTGDFILAPSPTPLAKNVRRLLWIAGGIGLTPFLSMLSALTATPSTDIGDWDIKFILATREPEILLPLVSAACRGKPSSVRLTLDVLSNMSIPDSDIDGVAFRKHRGRLGGDFFVDPDGKSDCEGRDIYVCGSESFEKAALEALSRAGVEVTSVRREGFAY